MSKRHSSKNYYRHYSICNVDFPSYCINQDLARRIAHDYVLHKCNRISFRVREKQTFFQFPRPGKTDIFPAVVWHAMQTGQKMPPSQEKSAEFEQRHYSWTIIRNDITLDTQIVFIKRSTPPLTVCCQKSQLLCLDEKSPFKGVEKSHFADKYVTGIA